MEVLLKIQFDTKESMIKAQINFKKAPKDRITVTYLETRLENLERQWKVFLAQHKKLVEHKEYETTSYFKEDTFELIEELYIEYKSELKEMLNKLSENKQVNVPSNNENIKLPKIVLPLFSGSYTDWVSFRDLFLSLIHTNNTLDNVQKLHYLKTHLSGEAEQLVKHISIASDNYDTCWQELENRYNNKRYLANCIVKRFLSQKNIVVESSKQIKELLDTSNECLNALKNLNINIESWNLIVIHLLCLKLDNESRKMWESKISNSTEIPSFSQFKQFLEQRFRSLEFLDSNKKDCVKYNSKSTSVKSLHIANAQICEFCNDNHKIARCKEFCKKSTQARRDFVRDKGLCFNCLANNHSVKICRQPISCQICKKRHHSLLHIYNPLNKTVSQSQEVQSVNNIVATTSNPSIATSKQNECVSVVTNCSQTSSSLELLPTALVKAASVNGSMVTVRVLLDQGSQASYITESTVQLLGLKKIASKSSSVRLGEDKPTLVSKSTVSVKLNSLYDPNFKITVKAHVLKRLTTLLPERKFTVSMKHPLSSLVLADPQFNKPNKIDMVLSSSVYGRILEEGLYKGPKGYPIAQSTRLGWIISGEIQDQVDIREKEEVNHSYLIIENKQKEEEDVSSLLERFWTIESEPSTDNNKRYWTEEEMKCEELYKKTTYRDLSGRYVVKLPFKEPEPTCRYGNSKNIALKRFLMLEKRLINNPELKKEYTSVIEQYLQLGHMEVIPKEQHGKEGVVYLPHHPVIRADKSTTKVRVVFDASCLDGYGTSLNNNLMVGPTLQADLRHIIMTWRTYPICLVADIVQMYRQIKVYDDDTEYQRIFWRNHPQSEIQHLRILRVTFGTASAPYLAVRTLHQVAYDEGTKYPLAANQVLESFYIDDLMTGCQTNAEGLILYKELKELLKKGGFELQKWNSSSEELLKEIKKENNETGEERLKLDKIMKILGLTWNRESDVFEYCVQLPPPKKPETKRSVISDISRLYDPLGWLAPSIIIAKIFIQKLWISGIGWDEELPENLLNEWTTYRNDLSSLNRFTIPRWVKLKTSDVDVQLHGFCDASNDAYAAVVYLRTVDDHGKIHVNLVAAKTKVAPVKQISIPRLELCGATLLAKLLLEISQVLKIPKQKIHAWTDSSVVLAWLSNHPSCWKTFVANRVGEIMTLLETNQWAHVQSKDNPADCASRGVMPSQLPNIHLWVKGPKWLKHKVIEFGRRNHADIDLERKANNVCHLTVCEENVNNIWTKYSTLNKLIRVVAYCRRFVTIRKAKQNSEKLPNWLTAEELSDALNVCIKLCQKQHFDTENISKNNKLTCLNPFVDAMGILRVGGRLDKSLLDDNRKHPVILPAKAHLSYLLIANAHEKTLHGGTQLMMNYIRSKYWIMDLKNQVKFFVRRCIVCVRNAAQTKQQLMGQLPACRVIPSRPFQRTGVDYAGPISIRTTKGRGYRSYKGYICLFICMATRAIHLEAVSDLTSQGFISAFKRFVARRGYCSDLYSDNGTNMVGAAKELKKIFWEEKSTIKKEIAEWLSSNLTNWHFIPPHSPHFGGLWEAGIKSTKHHLKRVMGNLTLTFEELYTILTQIEACLNSRPISRINNDPEDQAPLTPGHFLVGEPLVLVPEINYETSNVSTLKRWQLTQRIIQHFWRRWSEEYLSQFMSRYKWRHVTPEPNVGDLVLVKEDNLPPAKWLYGIITQKHPGADNITRVVSLRFKGHTNIIKRPITKLCFLPMLDNV